MTRLFRSNSKVNQMASAPLPFAPVFGVRLGVLKETKMFLSYPLVKISIVGCLRAREVACSASDRQGSNFESCVWRAVSSHHPQEVLLAQFSIYVHKSGLKPDRFISLCLLSKSWYLQLF